MMLAKIRESEKLIENKYSAFVSFIYTAERVSKIKSLPTRWYNGGNHEWEIPIRDLTRLADSLNEQLIIRGKNIVYDPAMIKTEKKLPKLTDIKTKLFKHQIEAATEMYQKTRLLLGDEAGLGKTLSTIYAMMCKKHDGMKHCLIVCGVNSLKSNWAKEIEIHTNETPYVLGQRISKTNKIIFGGSKEKIDDLYEIQKKANNLKDKFFIITNIETLRNETIIDELNNCIKSNVIGAVVLDEAHKCVNSKAQQTKGLLKLNPDLRFALTATPLMNKPLDLWVPLHWLGVEPHSYYQFEKYYCDKDRFHTVIGYKHLPQLSDELESIMLRRLKKDVLDLPEKIYNNVYVEMNNEQTDIYKEILKDIKNNIDKIKMDNNPLSKLLRLRQATSCPEVLTSKKIDCAKFEVLDGILDDRISEGHKCLIVSNWTEVTDRLLERYKGYNPATITGKVADAKRGDEVNKLNNDPKCKVMIGTITALGTGLTLTGASSIIFVDEPWNYTNKLQCEDRIHRIGMKGSAEVVTLLTKDTIDEKIHQLVAEKKEISDYLVDKKKSVSEIMDFLISD